MVVVFDFELMVNQTSIAKNLPPYDDYEKENSIKEMPWLDIELIDCNCSRYPQMRQVALRGGSALPAVSQSALSDSCSDTDERDFSDPVDCEDLPVDNNAAAEDEESETLYAEYFKLKGSTYHEHFQKALKQCKQLLITKR